MKLFRSLTLMAAVFLLLSGHKALALTNKTLGSYDTAGSANDIVIVDNYAYVADGSDGVIVLNVTNPSSPTLAGQYDTPGTAVQLEVSGTVLLVADTTSLQLLNISNPTSPTFLGSYSQSGLTFNDVTTDGTYAYIVGPLSSVPTLEVIDITAPASPVFKKSLGVNAGSSVILSGSYAYLVGGKYLDVVNAYPALNLAGEYTGASTSDFNGIQVNGSLAYINDSVNSLQVVNVSNVTAMVLTYGTTTAGGQGGGVATSNGYLFLTSSSAGGLFIYDIFHTGQPVYVDTYSALSGATAVTVADTTAFVTGGAQGVIALDVSKPDTVPPVITLTNDNGGIPPVITLGGKYTDPGATGTDNIDGNLGVTTVNGIDFTTVGKYTITYTVTDRAGNKTTVTRTIIIAPLIVKMTTNTNGVLVTTVNGKKLTMAPFGKAFHSPVMVRKLYTHTLKDPMFLFIATGATNSTGLVLYNSKGVVMSRVSLTKVSTKGLAIDMAVDPATLSVMFTVTPSGKATSTRIYGINKSGLKSLGSVTITKTASLAIVRVLRLYDDEAGVATMVRGKTSTIRIWRLASSHKSFVRDAAYPLTKLILTATSIKLKP